MSCRLVADIGGTNSRLGLVSPGNATVASVKSYRNDDYSRFEEVLDAYIHEQSAPDIAELVIAVAGPVYAGRARLTNRDWPFHSASLAQGLGGCKVALLNDLAALGLASPHLDAASLAPVYVPAEGDSVSDQKLVVGVGTGFNVSPVLMREGAVQHLSVEYGHVGLPQELSHYLHECFEVTAKDFPTVEHVFSGRGYATLSSLHKNRGLEGDFPSHYATLLAMLSRNLMLAYLPRGGLFFAGGVARNLLCSPAKDAFVKVFQRPFGLETVQPAPVFAILDDAAALRGCAAFKI